MRIVLNFPKLEPLQQSTYEQKETKSKNVEKVQSNTVLTGNEHLGSGSNAYSGKLWLFLILET